MPELPPIPAEARQAVLDTHDISRLRIDTVLDAAWPHLYAAVLRHLATLLDADNAQQVAERGLVSTYAAFYPDELREMADEALRP